MLGLIKIYEEQFHLSKELTGQLFKELKPFVDNGKFSALRGYLRGPYEDIPGSFNSDAMAAVVISELEASVLSSVKGYTDWVLCRIAHSGNYLVPTPNEIEFIAIEGKYDAPPETLRRTVGFMHSKDYLPLLGKINQGEFCPNKKELQEWKDMYGW